VALATFVAAAAITTILWLYARDKERDRRQLAFEVQVNSLADEIEFRVNSSVDVVRSAASLIAVSEAVSREEFRIFAQPILERHPHIVAVQWMPLVRDAEREALEARVRAEGFRTFRFQERERGSVEMVAAGRRADYLPLLYMEPLISAILGFDIAVAAFPTSEDAAVRARSSGHSTVSKPLDFAVAEGAGPDVIYFKPVLRPLPPAPGQEVLASRSAPSDRGVFIGVAAVILRPNEVVKSVVADGESEGIRIELVDETDPGERIVLSGGTEPEASATVGSAWSRSIEFGGRLWTVHTTPLPGTVWVRGGGVKAVLLVGLGISTLLALGSATIFQVTRLRKRMGEALELGQYSLGRLLGRGGMGVVYEAQHRLLARGAAIKLIRPEALTESDGSTAAIQTAVARFEREARATAQLRSPNTIDIYDFGRTEGGELYYVMELLDGLDLSSLVERFGPVEQGRAIFLLRQVCHSLAEAHADGLVHRDIKPQNIYLCRRGLDYDVAKVLDFGLIRRFHGTTEEEQLTQTHMAVGTPAFIAPEMATGEPDVDARADIYSLGCVAYWLLAGRLVFEGKTASEVLTKHIRDVPVPPSAVTELEVSADLERVVLACLEKDPKDRPPTAHEVSMQLAACASAGDWDSERARRWWDLHRDVPA